jgi:hypothetical protein
MKKVNKFIREFYLKHSRKFKHISAECFGTRFITDSNAKSISFETTTSYEICWNLTIVKHNGKYTVTIARMDCNDIIYEKSWVTSKDSTIEKLINHEILKADAFCVKNKHHEDLGWQVITDPSDLYDDTKEIICGELPEGFEPLDNPPSEISI